MPRWKNGSKSKAIEGGVGTSHTGHVRRERSDRGSPLDSGQRTTLPTTACFLCGERGWCGHGGRINPDENI